MVQSATALLASGRKETAQRALVYLACSQAPDGSFPLNFSVDGTPYWSGVQLGLRRLRLRRLRFVGEQFYLAATVQNLKRLVRFLSSRPTPEMATA